MQLLTIADDLTGAIEVGALFAGAGIAARVCCHARSIDPIIDPMMDRATDFPVVVANAATRHLPGQQAAAVVRELAGAARARGVPRIYQKTDSTLRGNIAAELSALVAAAGGALLYVPAYPRLGRTVVDGCLFVEGVPVHATAFARDALNPVRDSSIVRMLQAASRYPVASIAPGQTGEVEQPGIYVCDGETEADVEEAARAFLATPELRLVAGPAGVARALAALAPWAAGSSRAARRVTARTALVVNGSRHERSLLQVRAAGEAGLFSSEDEAWRLAPPPSGTLSAEQAARTMAAAVLAELRRRPVDALIVFGGDTAQAILAMLNVPELAPMGELLPGVPCARMAAAVDGVGELLLVTKAGGFGAADVLMQLRRVLEEGIDLCPESSQ